MEIKINLIYVVLIPIIHWIADFVLQTNEEAIGKSSSWFCLLSHTIKYSLFWFIYLTIFIILKDGFISKQDEMNLIYFTVITFVIHTITDYFTSRLNKHLSPDKEYHIGSANGKEENKFFRYVKGSSFHKFFIGIGFDQCTHYIQLTLTFYYLFNF